MPRKKGAPAASPEQRESEIVSEAFDLAQKQVREGSASAAVLVHFLKLGTERDMLERERLRRENILLEAKTAQIGSKEAHEEVLEKALIAFAGYKPSHDKLGEVEDFGDYDD